MKKLVFTLCVGISLTSNNHILAMSTNEQPSVNQLSCTIREYVDRAVRLKVTNNCPFSCRFCHNEGTELPEENSGNRVSTMLDAGVFSYAPVEDVRVSDIEEGVDGLVPSDSLFQQLDTFKELGFNEIHLTGGEPTYHPKLARVVQLLREKDFSVKMTSNGQFSDKTVEKLKQAGLSAVTFSVLSLDPREFLETQLKEYSSDEAALSGARRAIERMVKSIKKSKDLGLSVKLNVVVLGEHDTQRVDRILDFAQENKVTINLLPSVLSTDPTAEDKKRMEEMAIHYALNKGARYIETVQSSNNSNGAHHFVLPNGTPLRVKFIRDCQPAVLCADCEHAGKDSCTENFYGVRVEYRADEPFIRLCVQKSTPKTLMPLSVFVNSPLAALVPAISK